MKVHVESVKKLEKTEGYSFAIRRIDKKRWEEDLEIFRNLFNETFRDEWKFHPLQPEVACAPGNHPS